MVSKTTSQIKVNVHAEYDAQNSFPFDLRHTFRYNITIENRGQDKVQLIRRKWDITDLGMGESHIEGEGVRGMKPIVDTGEAFEYFSNVILQSGIGAMRGFYIFKNLTTEEYFEVEIPRFKLFSNVLCN